MAKKTPAELIEEVQELRTREKTLESELRDRLAEADDMIRDRILELLTRLALKAEVWVKKDKRQKKWIFSVCFNEADLKNRPDVHEAFADVRSLEKVCGAYVIQEEAN